MWCIHRHFAYSLLRKYGQQHFRLMQYNFKSRVIQISLSRSYKAFFYLNFFRILWLKSFCFPLQATWFPGWDWIKTGPSQVNPVANLNVLHVLAHTCRKKICNSIYDSSAESHLPFSVLNVPTKATVASPFKCILKDFTAFREALSLYNSFNKKPKVCMSTIGVKSNCVLNFRFVWFSFLLNLSRITSPFWRCQS